MSERQRVVVALRRFGTDAVSFMALESGIRHWFRHDPGNGPPHSIVPYVDTGRSWIGVGSPLVATPRVAKVAYAFVRDARQKRRQACFFASEAVAVPGFSRLLLGEQPVWPPATWTANVARHRRLREQIRRAASKGVSVRRVHAHEIVVGTRLRARIDALACDWLASRRMAPMGFLVALEPFHLPEEHRYFIAEVEGRVVAFASAVPVYARRGWLVEDVVRSARAPNGTSEALLDVLMRDVGESDTVTLGLAPLSGPVASWLRLVGFLTRPMFDFAGLRAFRQRLRPVAWEKVWLLYPETESPLAHVLESLRAFAGGSLLRFALRSIARSPAGPCWALALPLVPWTILLAALVTTGHASVVGFSAAALAGCAAFDAILAIHLFRSALRPKLSRLALAAAAAAVDAGLSVPHLLATGLGTTVVTWTLRGLAAFAPCFGAVVLGALVLRASGRFAG